MTDAQGKLTVLNELQPGCWINILDPTKEEIDKVCKMTGTERDFITAALDEEERPRIESEEGCTLVLTDIPVVESTTDSTYSFMFSTMPMAILSHFRILHNTPTSLIQKRVIWSLLQERKME